MTTANEQNEIVDILKLLNQNLIENSLLLRDTKSIFNKHFFAEHEEKSKIDKVDKISTIHKIVTEQVCSISTYQFFYHGIFQI
jgi:hypothetical protein